MLVVLQGSLRHFPPTELLTFLANGKHSGTLHVDAKGHRTKLSFKDGIVIWGEGPASNDLPSIVAELLNEDEATFAFLDGLEVPANATESMYRVDALLAEAQNRAAILRTFPDDVRFRVADKPPGPEVSLKAEHFQLLIRIGSGRTFGELAADGDANRDDLAASIRVLESNGLIVRDDSSKPAQSSTAKSPKIQQPEPTPEPVKPKKRRAGALTSAGADAAVHPLIGDTYTIGRDATNNIVIADASVSSKHARIIRTPDGFALEDLGSRNGTFVNGDAVKDTVALADNDMIRFGKVMFTFNLAAEIDRSDTTQRKVGSS